MGTQGGRPVFPQLLRVLPNFHESLNNSKETRRTCLLFRLENFGMKKKKNSLFNLIIKMKIPFACARRIPTSTTLC